MSTVRRVCPVCAGHDLGVYLEGQDRTMTPRMIGSSRTDVNPGRILRCRQCRFGFREVPSSESELVELYRHMDSQLYNAEGKGRSTTSKAYLHMVQNYVRRKGRLLDVGCASGLFLRHAMDAGWDVVGVEPAEGLCRTARELLGPQAEIHGSTLQATHFNPASFDAITLWDVLEHVPDPVSFLERCASVLKPGGYLFAKVPDLDSLQSRLLGSRWPLLLPEHLSYFNVGSLRLCGDRAGIRWVASCRRPVALSIGYILYRLGQHQIPGISYAHRLVRGLSLETRLMPVHLGEICGVWEKGTSAI
jgi:SAM-dependent methyltransferase